MSIERALIAQTQPFMVAARSRALVQEEIVKGCEPEISPMPVSLEPHFHPLGDTRGGMAIGPRLRWTMEAPPAPEELVRLRVWISPEQEVDWNYSELFIKQLRTMEFRSGFEIAGNSSGITISFLTHRSDLPIITAVFHGEFESCELTPMEESVFSGLSDGQWANVSFQDYFPSPPYSHLLTRLPELHVSPLISLIRVMSLIEAPAVGLYQALFQAVRPENDWHHNIEILIDLEFTSRLMGGFQIPQRYPQQSPSGDQRQMAADVESKAHNDKPILGLSLRMAVFAENEKGKNLLSSLSTFSSLFQHGGRPLRYITEKEYESLLSPKQIRDMFILGLTYRPGFLVNSGELTGPVHIPPLHIDKQHLLPVEILETLSALNPDLSTGTWIGTCSRAGKNQNVCIPPGPRNRHTHIIGRPGTFKSTTLEHMVLSDADQGHGVAVLDPHGDLVERLLCLIPERHAERTIYLNPGDPEWVPIWNPLKRIPGQNISRTTDDIVQAIKSFVSAGGWGDRLEHLLRNIIFSLIHLSNGTFLDISDLLRNDSVEAQILRSEILKVVDNESVRQFWLHDYEAYRKDDLGPPKNKLSKLLVSGTLSLILSQPETRINFRRIMDEGMILLVNLSTIGSLGDILGCFILSLFYQCAVSRSDLHPEERKQFYIYCDEAHRFLTDALEDLIAETRKYKVSLTLAHQFFAQMAQGRDAFSSVGSTIIFNVDSNDAGYLIKNLRGLVNVDDITSLKNGNAIARIGTDIVRLKTRDLLEIPSLNFRDRIIEESRRKYYKPVHEVEKWIRRRGERWRGPFTPLVPASSEEPGSSVKELPYEEF